MRVALGVLVLLLLAVPARTQTGRPPTRAAFVRALNRVRESIRIVGERPFKPDGVDPRIRQGMERRQVLALLGAPDEIMPIDADAPDAEKEEQWLYGVADERGRPTLGTLTFGPTGRVQFVTGADGSAVSPILPPEPVLRSVLAEIEWFTWAPLGHFGPNGFDWDPLRTLRLVNRLRGLGRQKALGVLREEMRLSAEAISRDEIYESGSPMLFCLMPILFDAPADPDVYVDREPIVLWRQVPLLVKGRLGGGGGSSAFGIEHFEHYRLKGRWKEGLVVPPDDPLVLIDEIGESLPKYREELMRASELRRALMEQVLKLVEPAYHREPDRSGSRLPPGANLEEQWQKVREETAGLRLRWDAKRQVYVREEARSR